MDKRIVEIKRIFESNSDRYICHELAAPILTDLSMDKAFIFEIFKQNLANKKFLDRERHYSTLALDIIETENFSILINIFPPLPDRTVDTTFQSIHHHGSLLLSTVGFHGSSYSSIMYKKGFEIDKKTNTVNLEIEEYYQNINHQVKFCDAYQPHVVFYPRDFSATIVLWSDFQSRAKDNIKKIPLIARFKKPLGKLIRKLRMEGVVGITRIENFDFYRENGIYYAMKERKAYDSSCDNANYLQNIFAFIQSYGFNDLEFLNSLKLNPDFPKHAIHLIDKLIQGDIISDSFCDKHLDIPFVNLKRKILLS
jgi:hypothetical protein